MNAIEVTATRDRWRGGQQFRKGVARTLTEKDLTEEQAQAILDDTALSVRPVELPDEEEADAQVATSTEATGAPKSAAGRAAAGGRKATQKSG